MKRLTWVVGVLLGAAGCADLFTNCVCTQEFRTYSLTIVDSLGAAIPDVEVTVRNLRSGRTLVPLNGGVPGTPGTYVIADDSMRDEFTRGGDDVRVTGEKGGLQVQVPFRFAVDECKCHVIKLSGPDSVVMK